MRLILSSQQPLPDRLKSDKRLKIRQAVRRALRSHDTFLVDHESVGRAGNRVGFEQVGGDGQLQWRGPPPPPPRAARLTPRGGGGAAPAPRPPPRPRHP